ncbi:hypothetical protein GCM10010442_53480 [Kitasatospora kifunensis]
MQFEGDQQVDRRVHPSCHRGVRVPRMNAVMERWVLSLRRELLDRTLIWAVDARQGQRQPDERSRTEGKGT